MLLQLSTLMVVEAGMLALLALVRAMGLELLLQFCALMVEAGMLILLTLAPQELRYPLIRRLKQAVRSRLVRIIIVNLVVAGICVFVHGSWLLHAGKQFSMRCETANYLEALVADPGRGGLLEEVYRYTFRGYKDQADNAALEQQLEGQKCMLRIRTLERNWYLQGGQVLLLFLLWRYVCDAEELGAPTPSNGRKKEHAAKPPPPSADVTADNASQPMTPYQAISPIRKWSTAAKPPPEEVGDDWELESLVSTVGRG